MNHRNRDQGKRGQEGFSLLELLLVLVIVTILAVIGVRSMTPNTPRAVKVGLTELRGLFVQARSLAASSGRTVVISGNWSNGVLSFQQVADDFTLMSPPLSTISLDANWRRSARIAAATAPDDTLTPGQSTPATLVPAIVSFAGTAAGTLSTPVNTTTGAYGFNPTGVPVLLDTSVAGTAPAPLANGTWIGVVGNTLNISGPPYGIVVINGLGNTTAYYKADSKLDTPAENLWKRMD